MRARHCTRGGDWSVMCRAEARGRQIQGCAWGEDQPPHQIEQVMVGGEGYIGSQPIKVGQFQADPLIILYQPDPIVHIWLNNVPIWHNTRCLTPGTR